MIDSPVKSIAALCVEPLPKDLSAPGRILRSESGTVFVPDAPNQYGQRVFYTSAIKHRVHFGLADYPAVTKILRTAIKLKLITTADLKAHQAAVKEAERRRVHTTKRFKVINAAKEVGLELTKQQYKQLEYKPPVPPKPAPQMEVTVYGNDFMPEVVGRIAWRGIDVMVDVRRGRVYKLRFNKVHQTIVEEILQKVGERSGRTWSAKSIDTRFRQIPASQPPHEALQLASKQARWLISIPADYDRKRVMDNLQKSNPAFHKLVRKALQDLRRRALY